MVLYCCVMCALGSVLVCTLYTVHCTVYSVQCPTQQEARISNATLHYIDGLEPATRCYIINKYRSKLAKLVGSLLKVVIENKIIISIVKLLLFSLHRH